MFIDFEKICKERPDADVVILWVNEVRNVLNLQFKDYVGKAFNELCLPFTDEKKGEFYLGQISGYVDFAYNCSLINEEEFVSLNEQILNVRKGLTDPDNLIGLKPW